LVPNSLPKVFIKFFSNSFGYVNGSKSSGLGADDVDTLVVSVTMLKDKFGNLGRFTTTCITRNDKNLVF
jgi:hypothetical protein